ncbi:lariat debranching enzyme [Oleoguttula sp. CCFEE 5521]
MATESTLQLEEHNGLRLAIEGCGHGTLHAIYASIAHACKAKGWPSVDLLIIGGDFQSVRNGFDLNVVAMPAKYREMGDFYEYYSGARKAPCLTVFVGGNHEASNYLFELYYGGWVAESIYYMGAANVLRIGGVRIAGLSGIWKAYNYRKVHYERLPYNESEMKSIYHVRELDVRKLLQVRTQIDVGISHDWPRGVEWKGDWAKLFRRKGHFEEDARSGQLGSVAAKLVMERLRPRWWFSAHLHCKFAGVVRHAEQSNAGGVHNGTATQPSLPPPTSATAPKNAEEIELDLDDDDDEAPVVPVTDGSTEVESVNKDEIDLELEDEDDEGVAAIAPGQGLDGVQVQLDSTKPAFVAPSHTAIDLAAARAALPASFQKPLSGSLPATSHPADIKNTTTHFLALDKCLPNRDFLQLMSIPASTRDLDSRRPLHLEYDPEWLSITRAFALTEPLILGDPKFNAPQAESETEYSALIDESRAWINANISDFAVPNNFTITAPVYDGGDFRLSKYSQAAGGLREYTNPQTSSFCDMLGLGNPFDIDEEERAGRLLAGPRPDAQGDGFEGGRGRGVRGGFDRGRGRDRSGGAGRSRGRGRGGRGGY